MNNTVKHHKYYRPLTTEVIIQDIDISEEELFWTKIDVATKYLKTKFSGDQYAALLSSHIFFEWWLRIWETLDKRFLIQFKSNKKKAKQYHYSNYMYYGSLNFYMDDKAIASILSNYKIQKNGTSKKDIDHRSS